MTALRNAILASLALAASLLVAAPASASLRELTLTGVAQPYPGSEDAAGLFGSQHNITGETFVATFVFDSDAVVDQSLTITHGGQSWPFAYSYVTPISGTLSIRGVTVDIQAPLLDIDKGNADNRNFIALWGAADTQLQITPTQALPFSLNDDFYAEDFASGNAISIVLPTGDRHDTHVVGPITSLRIGAIPEPSSWALMLTGFALAGGAIRARRRPSLS